MIAKRKCRPCASRGRGEGYKQQMEVRNDVSCNAITTASKDSMVVAKVVRK